ncbi:MAG: energy transducer TonB [Alphaproteobacteria bacterium]|nr:energy transducer TonB [Alphaproteobacteria bacterium]
MEFRHAVVAALGVMAFASVANAQEIVDPSWASIPDAGAMGDAYPEFASRMEFAGEASLRCMVAPDGTLALCRVDTASPAGLGFDRAALSLVPGFRLNPRQVDGAATKSSVQFTIRFRMPSREAPPPWTGAEPSPEHLAAVEAFMRRSGMLDAMTNDLQTPDLMVDADREDRLRAMVGQVLDELGREMEQASVLGLARILTPGQLDVLREGGEWPARPRDDLLESAGDVAALVGTRARDRLVQLYCAEFDCPAAPPAP